MNHLRAVPGVPAGPRDPSTPPPRSGSASSVRVEAPGKVNLFLSVGASGTDGYHQLTTVFQAVRLIETVTARRQSARDRGTVTLTLEEPDADVPADASNLAVRAAKLLAETTGVSEGVDLLLRKRVPVAGGMAGDRPTPPPPSWPATSCGARVYRCSSSPPWPPDSGPMCPSP